MSLYEPPRLVGRPMTSSPHEVIQAFPASDGSNETVMDYCLQWCEHGGSCPVLRQYIGLGCINCTRVSLGDK